MTSIYAVARAHLRSWWRRRRGRPDTCEDYLRDLGFQVVEYRIDPGHDVEDQIAGIVRDLTRRVRHPGPQ